MVRTVDSTRKSGQTLQLPTNKSLELKHMNFGTVRCFDSSSGEGWITPDDGGRDIFVHQSAVDCARLGQLARGQTLGFHLADGQRTAVDLWATWSNR